MLKQRSKADARPFDDEKSGRVRSRNAAINNFPFEKFKYTVKQLRINLVIKAIQ
jgi:hypothetical protein